MNTNATNGIRYFFYSYNYKRYVVIFDEKCSDIKIFPDDPTIDFSRSKSVWMGYYESEKSSKKPKMFEICENQFKKYQLYRTVPENWDW
jgi:hypothetical protein